VHGKRKAGSAGDAAVAGRKEIALMDDRITFPVAMNPQAWKFLASADQTLLLSAAKAGIILPSSCRNGTCRTCISRITSGHVHYRIEWPGLSAEEKRDGYILPCVAYPQSDLTLENGAARRA
jgi:ferredoxin